MKSFEHWETEEVELSFGIREVKDLNFLLEWTKAQEPISQKEKEVISHLQNRLTENVIYWQEDEIKSFFNIPLIELVEFYRADYQYNIFTQRILSGKLQDVNNNEIELAGRVELIVAQGKQKPRQPYFFVNEYKPQIKGKNDPQGQLLIAMCVMQGQNEKLRPVLGVYVIGKFWQFVVLQDKDYSVSQSFDATQEDIWQIFQILKRTKAYIEEWIKNK